MKLYLLEDHELPVISGVALVRTGNLFDPPDKRGLATMTGDVLRSGGTKAKIGRRDRCATREHRRVGGKPDR